MNRKIYRQIAKAHGVSVAEVKRDMQTAVNAAYQSPNPAAREVPRAGETPTSEELVAHIVRALQASDR